MPIESKYRPGTAQKGPGKLIAGLIVLLILVGGSAYYFTRHAGSSSSQQGTSSPSPVASATAASSVSATPSATPVALDPNNPTSYMALFSVDPNTLPPDQQKIAKILNQDASGINHATADETTAIQGLDSTIFAPLRTAKTKQDLEAIKPNVQKIQDAVQKTQSFYTQVQTTVTSDLQSKAGMPEALAKGVGDAVVAKAQMNSGPRTEALTKLGQNLNDMIDFLEKNGSKWQRKSDNSLVFKSSDALHRYQELTTQQQGLIKSLNEAMQNMK